MYTTDQILKTVYAYVARMATTVSFLGIVTIATASMWKVLGVTSLTWFDVFTPLLAMMLAVVVLTLGMMLAGLLISVGLFGVTFGVGRVFMLLNKRRAAQLVQERMEDADNYDRDAFQTAANTPLGKVGNAMNNVGRQLANFNRPGGVHYTQDDTRL